MKRGRLIYECELIRRILEIPDMQKLSIATVGKAISECATIDAEPVRHGWWRQDYKRYKWIDDWIEEQYLKCSECEYEEYWLGLNDYSTVDDYPNYCPNCGAKMDLEEEK